jgi:transcriptional regulator NrdR family protein
MVCIHCQSETQVSNSRLQKKLNRVWRRRACSQGHVFTTLEAADYASQWLVAGAPKRLQPFSRDKLFISLYQSLQHRKTALSDASALTDTIIQKLAGQITDGVIASSTVTSVAQIALNRFDSAASSHYQAFHPSK